MELPHPQLTDTVVRSREECAESNFLFYFGPQERILQGSASSAPEQLRSSHAQLLSRGACEFMPLTAQDLRCLVISERCWPRRVIRRFPDTRKARMRGVLRVGQNYNEGWIHTLHSAQLNGISVTLLNHCKATHR